LDPFERLQACRISDDIDLGGNRSPEVEWLEIHAELLSRMIRFKTALSPLNINTLLERSP
jgi:hypothetical protein